MNSDKLTAEAKAAEEAKEKPEEFLEVRPVPPIQIETAASRRFDKLAATRERREAVRAEVERLKAEGALPTAPPPAPKPDYEPSETVKRTQKLLEQIEQRKRERARLTSEKLRRGVEIERENREGEKALRETVAKLEEEVRQKINGFRDDFGRLLASGASELNARQAAIDKLDVSLASLKKQLEVELAKVDADLAPKEGA